METAPNFEVCTCLALWALVSVMLPYAFLNPPFPGSGRQDVQKTGYGNVSILFVVWKDLHFQA